MLGLICMSLIAVFAVFRLDSVVFAVKEHAQHRHKGLCCMDGEETLSDPDGRPYPAN
jgi:hypothetical protein